MSISKFSIWKVFGSTILVAILALSSCSKDLTKEEDLYTSKTLAKAPGPVVDAKAVLGSSSNIQLSWSPPTDFGLKADGKPSTIRGYEVRYSQFRYDLDKAIDDNSTPAIKGSISIADNVNSFELKGLSGITEYYVSVIVYNKEGLSAFTELKTSPIKTANISVYPDKVTELTAVPDTEIPGKVFISWTSPKYAGLNEQGGNSQMSYYVIQYGKDSTFKDFKNTDKIFQVAYTLEGLELNAKYYIRVLAYNSELALSISEKIDFQTN